MYTVTIVVAPCTSGRFLPASGVASVGPLPAPCGYVDIRPKVTTPPPSPRPVRSACVLLCLLYCKPCEKGTFINISFSFLILFLSLVTTFVIVYSLFRYCFIVGPLLAPRGYVVIYPKVGIGRASTYHYILSCCS